MLKKQQNELLSTFDYDVSFNDAGTTNGYDRRKTFLVAESSLRVTSAQRRRRRREVVCLFVVLISLVICLSFFTILNGDIDLGFALDGLDDNFEKQSTTSSIPSLSSSMTIFSTVKARSTSQLATLLQGFSPTTTLAAATTTRSSHQRPENSNNFYYNNNNGDDHVGSSGDGSFSPFLMSSSSINHVNNYFNEYGSNEIINDPQFDAKLILLWTAWYKDPEWKKVFAKNGGPWISFNDRDPETGSVTRRLCYLTTNRSQADPADALIFHSTDFRRNYTGINDVPATRYPWQKYIFFTLEPPQLNRLNDKTYRDFVNVKMQFNATMSYSRYSDIVFPYGHVFDFNDETRNNPNFVENVRQRIATFVQSFPYRPKDAVWIVSDCETMGRRENIVHSLNLLGIKIDIWGKCWDSKQPDQLWHHFGTRTFFQQYRFYLAFENALCEEYITEKAYQALAASAQYGLIPIVYGLANYSHFLPPGSYIDSTNLPNAGELARIIREISSPDFNQEKLASYFGWQYKHYVPSDHNNWRVVNGWRNMCRYLHQKSPAPPPQLKSSLVVGDYYQNVTPAPVIIPAPAPVVSTNTTCLMSVLSDDGLDDNKPRTADIRWKIGACVWTSDFSPEYASYFGLQF